VTDGWTDRQNYDSQDRASIATRGKNQFLNTVKVHRAEVVHYVHIALTETYAWCLSDEQTGCKDGSGVAATHHTHQISVRAGCQSERATALMQLIDSSLLIRNPSCKVAPTTLATIFGQLW